MVITIAMIMIDIVIIGRMKWEFWEEIMR